MKAFRSIAVSVVLSLFYMAIVLFLMLKVLFVQDCDNSVSPFVFVGISFIAVLVVVGFGKSVSKAIGSGMYPGVCLSTVLYAVAAAVYNCAAADKLGFGMFTLFDLIILFVYLAATLPIAVRGANSDVLDTEEKPNEIKYHNVQ